ncbi:MAG: hypothetical protein U5O39_11795 [Gammaproteobacteria bacterium]|nr:hypothetical protein [Gammaproteobacteria bacterium]
MLTLTGATSTNTYQFNGGLELDFTGASINDGDVIPIMTFPTNALSGTFGFVNDNLPAGATAAVNYNTSSVTVTITVSSIGFDNDSGDNTFNNPLNWSLEPCRTRLPTL